MNIQPKTIFTQDNLPVMRGMNSESVDLIYLDPPFNSNANYAAPIGSEAAGAEFKDTWSLSDIDLAWHGELADKHQGLHDFLLSVQKINGSSMLSYLIYMAIRLLEMHRILKDTGSIYLHCDPYASHYLKLLMDTIFDKNNFKNEIIWSYSTGGISKNYYARKHDIILFYSKTKQKTFIQPRIPTKDPTRFNKTDKGGRKYYEKAGNRYYLDDGVTMTDVWEISPVRNTNKSRVGYPTQKPLPLLERIIKASSNAGDIVLDPFCGCATACLASEQLKRAWIGIDTSSLAYTLVTKRFKKELNIFNPDIVHRVDIPTRTDIGRVPRYNIIRNKNCLYGEQQGNCNGCKMHFPYRNLTIDHKVPKSKNGTDHIDNLQLLCGACNSTKGQGTQEELIVKLKENKILGH